MRARESPSVWTEENIFNKEALVALLHTPISTGAKRGVLEFTLTELLHIAHKRGWGNATRFIEDAVPRAPGRLDVTLSRVWVEEMARVNAAFAKAVDIAGDVRKRMMNPKHRKVNIVWHAQIVQPRSPDQPVHVDDGGRQRGRYLTLIIPLTQDPRAGGTHFPSLDYTFSSFGGALAFDGTVTHAGLGNRSNTDRVFLYAAIFTGKDRN